MESISEKVMDQALVFECQHWCQDRAICYQLSCWDALGKCHFGVVAGYAKL